MYSVALSKCTPTPNGPENKDYLLVCFVWTFSPVGEYLSHVTLLCDLKQANPPTPA